jgi:hypothetical protein
VALEALVSVVLLAAILHWAGIHRVLHELSKTQLRWFIPAVAVSIATVPVMALRWRLLLSAKRIDVPLAWLTRTYFVALFAGQFLPAAIGGTPSAPWSSAAVPRRSRSGRLGADRPPGGLVSLVVLAVAAVAIGGGSAPTRRYRRRGRLRRRSGGTLALLFSSRLRGVVARRSSRGPTATGLPPAAGSTTRFIPTAGTRARWRWWAASRSSCRSLGWV